MDKGAMRSLKSPILAMIGFTGLYTGAAAALEPNTPAAIEDPFGYCLRVGTADTPTGGASPVPTVLLPSLRAAAGLPADAPIAKDTYYWRCMDGAVLICAIGANIPCHTKADRSKRNSGAEHYCRENPSAPFVPAYATGHSSIYAWSCSDGRAVRGKAWLALDQRGYPVNFWHRLTP